MNIAAMVASAPTGAFIAMMGVVLAMAGIALFAGVHALRRARLIRSVPTSSIGSATDGYREFEGTIKPIDGQRLRAPLTGAECCWYRARVEEWVRPAGKGADAKRDWRLVRELISGQPFLARDASGACIVDPDGADVTPTDRSVWRGATAVPQERDPPRVKPGENAEGFVTKAGGENRFRYTEERIYGGDPLYVLGWFETAAPDSEDDDDEDADDSDEADSDDDRSDAGTAGAVDSGTGEQGYRFPFEVADSDWPAAAVLQRAAGSRRLGRSPQRGQPFLISTTPQDRMVEMSTFGAKGALFFALVPLAVGALLLWWRFGS